VVPRVLLKRGRRRRISLEVHKVEDTVGDGGKNRQQHSYEECIVRILAPESKDEHRESLRRLKAKLRSQDNEDEDVSDEVSTSGHSVALSTTTGHDEFYYGANADLTTQDGWCVKYRFPVSALLIKGSKKRSVVVEIAYGRRRDVREIIFDSLEDAYSVSPPDLTSPDVTACFFAHTSAMDLTVRNNVESRN
jgi:hypothetical protein